MQPRRAGNIWSNEDAQLAQKSTQAAGAAVPKADSKAKPDTESPKASEAVHASEHGKTASKSSARTADEEGSASEGEWSMPDMHTGVCLTQ